MDGDQILCYRPTLRGLWLQYCLMGKHFLPGANLKGDILWEEISHERARFTRDHVSWEDCLKGRHIL